ncbi:MAG: MFS transporter [Promethearchaeota archaeon]
MFKQTEKNFREFPQTFWVLVRATFIDKLGIYILFPFYAIYIINQLGATMTQIGLLFMLQAVGGMIGSFIGGAVTDKLGRKKVALFGLLVSGFGTLGLGFATRLETFYLLSIILGLLGSIGGPARQAMVPDLLPPGQRTEGFGILRIGTNIAATIGPMLGGFLASRNYMILFVGDAIEGKNRDRRFNRSPEMDCTLRD